MKKLLSLLCVLSLSAALLAGCSTAGDAGTSETPGSSSTPSEVTEPGSSQETVDSLDVNVMALKGPTAMGMVKMMADSEPVEEFTDQLKEEYENVVSSGNIYHFTITSATDEVSAALAQGTTDIAAVPANLASVLYNNTEGGVQVLAINTLGVLYIVESGDTVHSVEDLRGKTVYASGKGNTPEAALNYVLTQNGIDLSTDVTIEWKSEQAECLSALMAEENAIAMLPQPFVTTAQAQSENLRVALDLTEEWDALQADSETPSTLSPAWWWPGPPLQRNIRRWYPPSWTAIRSRWTMSTPTWRRPPSWWASMRPSPPRWLRRPCRSATSSSLRGTR